MRQHLFLVLAVIGYLVLTMSTIGNHEQSVRLEKANAKLEAALAACLKPGTPVP